MGIITTERLKKILSETQAVISECNARGVHGSVEVNARLFENLLMELLRHRAVMLQGAESDESPTTMQTAPALDSSQIIAESPSGNSPVIPDCSCGTCRPVTFTDSRFVVCSECGNKRCPHANDHRNACTGSNEPGQEGSAYPAAPQQEVK